MKPIETEYDNHLFRSRLEARWAVFFKYLKVNYRYELEGYDLDGTWYLPDFFLTKQKYWIEIKPIEPKDEEIMKAKKLCLHTRKDVMICVGDPLDNKIPVLFTWWPLVNGHGVEEEQIPKDEGKVINFADDTNIGWFYSEKKGLITDIIHKPHMSEKPSGKVLEASKFARQARFEHGNKP